MTDGCHVLMGTQLGPGLTDQCLDGADHSTQVPSNGIDLCLTLCTVKSALNSLAMAPHEDADDHVLRQLEAHSQQREELHRELELLCSEMHQGVLDSQSELEVSEARVAAEAGQRERQTQLSQKLTIVLEEVQGEKERLEQQATTNQLMCEQSKVSIRRLA